MMISEGKNVGLAGKRAWRTLDVVLLGGFVVTYAVLFGVLHVVAYLSGLQRRPSGWLGIVILVLALSVVALLLVLTARMARSWRNHMVDRRRLAALCLLTVIGSAAYLVLPFTRFALPPYTTFTKGARKYVRANVDLGLVRVWLDTMDRKYDPDYVYDLASGATIEDWWPEAAPWAKAISPLSPHAARLSLDSSGHPAIRISWGGWGLVVGSHQMQTAPSGFSLYSEYRLPLDSGAYVWHERGGVWRAF